MSRVSKMSMEEILDKTDLIMRENDIIYFCSNIKVLKEYFKYFEDTNKDSKQIKQFLIKNEEYIDKEKMVLLLVKNYIDNLQSLEERKNELEIEIQSNRPNKEKNIQELLRARTQKILQGKYLEKTKKLGKGIEKVITFYGYDEKKQEYSLEVVDSRELIENKNVSNSKNLKRLDKMDEYLKENATDDTLGFEYIVQSLLLTDLYKIFPDEQFGDNVRTLLLENSVIRENIKTREELETIKSKDYQEYSDIVDNTEFTKILPYLKEVLREYSLYLDMDLLLLISAYRFYEGLENKTLKIDKHKTAEQILKYILLNIKDKDTKIFFELQEKKDGSYESKYVEYDIKDLEKSINQFTNEKYLTSKEIREYKEKVINEDINLSEIASDYIDVIFSKEELNDIAMLSDENFQYISNKLLWTNKEILEKITSEEYKGNRGNVLLKNFIDSEQITIDEIIWLYENKLTSIEEMKKVIETNDLSNNISAQKLNEYHKVIKFSKSQKEDIEKYNRYLDLYKEVLVKDKKQEELDKSSNKLMEQVVEDYQKDDNKTYIENIEEYYKQGILTLNSILEWDSKEVINQLYNDKLINLEEIQQLVKNEKLPLSYIIEKYRQIILIEDLDYDKRLEYISTGYVEPKDIFDLYKRNLIFENDINELIDKGILTEREVIKTINERTKEELEKHSSIKLTGLNNLTKKNNDIYSEKNERTEYNVTDSKLPKLIIDPNERLEYISLFSAQRADTDLEESSPFYNYEFYCIPDESGEIGLNSVVIAERYYDDKETEEKFALNNATYLFKYKDLMVLSNLKKSEMIKERKNIVFTVNHTLATEERNGAWAANLLYAIVKTRLSTDLKEYSKDNERKIVIEELNKLYSYDEVIEILDKAKDIDSGKFIYEIEDESDTKLSRNRRPKIGEEESR